MACTTGIAKYTVDDIPVELCTHLVYAFAVLDSKTLLAKQHDRWLDIDLKNYNKFVELKKKNPNLKVSHERLKSRNRLGQE